MAAGPITQISDVVTPEIFTPYVQQLTEEKSRLVQSGVLARSLMLDAELAGGGLVFNAPSWRDLDNDADRVSTDTAHSDYGGPASPNPQKIGTSLEKAVRLSRNQSWSDADLTSALAGDDPMEAIASRVAEYRARRLQAAFVATINGVLADNAAAPTGTDTHEAGDLTNDQSASPFSPERFIDTAVLLGDSAEDVSIVFMHSVIYASAQKQNLIDFIPDARGEIMIPTYLGRQVVVDDGMPVTQPVSENVYDTWLFGAGAVQLGVGSPRVPTAIQRHEDAGNGGGQSVLHNRWEWCIHPVGHAFIATPPDGGPANGTGAGELANAASWSRVFPERKQIKFARLQSLAG